MKRYGDQRMSTRIITFAQLKPEKGVFYSRDHLRRKWHAGEFAAPVVISGRRIGWIEREVDEWINQLVAARGETAAARAVRDDDVGSA
jgi:predicted DNA-binding transcriptional regulator AlpA